MEDPQHQKSEAHANNDSSDHEQLIKIIKAIAYFILVAVALANFSHIQKVVNQETKSETGKISNYERKLAQLKPFLPKNGRVGYLSDTSPFDLKASNEVIEEYYKTQYALAPIVVVPGADQDIVIVRLLNKAQVPSEIGNRKLVRNFGDGLMIFRDQTP